MGLKTHFGVRIALLFIGFFGGAVLHMQLGRTGSLGDLHLPLFFVLPLAGAYLLQAAFALLWPAACPSCGAAAVSSMKNPVLYLCRSCGAETNALLEQLAAMPGPEQQAKTESRLVWFFPVVGVALIGVAVWLGSDSIQLVRDGVSARGQVMRVTSEATRDSDGRSQTSYTAFIEYRVEEKTLTLERGWSVKPGGRCLWPCYDQGEVLKVIYLPGEPMRAEVHSLPALFFAPALFGGIGLLFTGFGALMIRRQRRGRDEP